MGIKGVTTIAEYAMRRWMLERNFAMDHFDLEVNGNTGKLTDREGGAATLVYDPIKKQVYMKEER